MVIGNRKFVVFISGLAIGNLELGIKDQPGALAWAAEKIGINRWPDDSQAVHVTRDGEMKAVVVYNTFFDVSCSAHIATDGKRDWANRGVLFGIFAYPFIQCDLRRITLPIASRNISAQILALKLGFVFEGRLVGARKDDDEILFGMLRERCIWTREDSNG